MFHGSSPLLSCQRRRSNGQTTMICSVLTWSRRWKENGKKGGKRNKAGERLKRNADIEKKKQTLRNKDLHSKTDMPMQNKMPWYFFLEKLNRFWVWELQQKKQQGNEREEEKKTVTCCSSMAAEGAGQMKATYQQVISQLSSIST